MLLELFPKLDKMIALIPHYYLYKSIISIIIFNIDHVLIPLKDIFTERNAAREQI